MFLHKGLAGCHNSIDNAAGKASEAGGLAMFVILRKHPLHSTEIYTLGTFRTRKAALNYAQQCIDHYEVKLEVKLARLIMDKRFKLLRGQRK